MPPTFTPPTVTPKAMGAGAGGSTGGSVGVGSVGGWVDVGGSVAWAGRGGPRTRFRGEPERGCEAEEGARDEQECAEQADGGLHVSSVDVNIRGSFVTTASTPASATRASIVRIVDGPRDHRRAARMRRADARPGHQRVVQDDVVRPRHRKKGPDERRGHTPQRPEREASERRTAALIGDAEDPPRNGEPDSHSAVDRRDCTSRSEVVGADEAPAGEIEPADGSDDILLSSCQLQVEMKADPRRFVDEESQRLVQGRRVRADVAGPVRDDETAVGDLDHVELDEVDARLDRGAEGTQRVLGRERRSTPVADAKWTSVPALERDHGVGLVGR